MLPAAPAADLWPAVFFTLKLMPSGAEVHGGVAESLEAPAASASSASASSTSAPPLRLPTGKNVNFKLSPDVVDSVPPFAQDRVRRAVARWQQDPEGATRSTLSAMLAWAPYAVLASLPFFTALLKLLYRQQPHGAHFVFALHLHAAWYLMLTFLVLVSWEWTPPSSPCGPASTPGWRCAASTASPGSARCCVRCPLRGPQPAHCQRLLAAGGDGGLERGVNTRRGAAQAATSAA